MPRGRKENDAPAESEVAMDSVGDSLAATKIRELKSLEGRMSRDELVSRLKAVSSFLTDVEQERADEVKQHVGPLAKSLARPALIQHNDKDVRLITACCLADVLRIYAPDAPYDTHQLKVIFQLFVEQLRGLDKPSSAAFTRCFYLLENLAIVQSFVVCVEYHFTETIVDLFNVLFTVYTTDHSHKVRQYMIDIMSTIFEDTQSIPNEVLDIVLEHILTNAKKGHEGPAYQLASELIQRASGCFTQSLHEFFAQLLGGKGSSTSDLAVRVYEIIIKLNEIAPSVLLYVLPQLEEQLKVEDKEKRASATVVLSRMFAMEKSTLARDNQPLWLAFLKRFVDIDVDIRLHLVENAKYFLVFHPELATDVQRELTNRLLDADDKVRLKTISSIFEAINRDPTSVSLELLEAAAQRMLDKKSVVRTSALTLFADLFKRLCESEGELQLWSKDRMRQYGWIPSKILCVYAQNDVGTRALVERLFERTMVPFNASGHARALRVLNIVGSLEGQAPKALTMMLREHRATRDAVKAFVVEVTSDEGNADAVRARLKTVAVRLPEPTKAAEHLAKLVAMEDPKLWKMVAQCLDVKLSFENIRGIRTEVRKRLSDKTAVADTVKTMIDRAGMSILDISNLPSFLLKLRDEDYAPLRSKGLAFMLDVAVAFPFVFKTSAAYEELVELLVSDETESIDYSLQILSLVGGDLSTVSSRLSTTLKGALPPLTLTSSVRQTKYAARACGTIFGTDNDVISGVYASLTKRLSLSSDSLPATLMGLSEIARAHPVLFETQRRAIINQFVVDKLLLCKAESPKKASKGKKTLEGPEWIHEMDVECYAKVMGVKLMVRWLLGVSDAVKQKEFGVPTLRMLCSAIEKKGELSKTGSSRHCVRSRVLLAASAGLLKLARRAEFNAMLSIAQFQSLAFVMQTDVFEVRRTLLDKLNAGLCSFKLPLQFMVMFPLVAGDPDKEMISAAKKYMAVNIKRRRDCIATNPSAKYRQFGLLPEYVLPYLIHLLAHHPDLRDDNAESIRSMQPYFSFFLDQIATHSDNYTFLNSLVETIKMTTDAQSEDSSKGMYVLCDLASALIQQKATSGQWKLKPNPGDVVLPGRLFKRISNPQQVTAKSYLPAGFRLLKGSPVAPAKVHAASAVSTRSPASGGSSGKKRPREDEMASPSRKNASRVSKSLIRSLKEDDDDDDDDDEEEEEESEEDDVEMTTTKQRTTTPMKSSWTPKVRSKVDEKMDESEDGEKNDDDDEEEEEELNVRPVRQRRRI